MSINTKLKLIRNKYQLSKKSFAEIIGVSQQTVSEWENGSKLPEKDKLILISEHFDIPLEELLKDESTMIRKPISLLKNDPVPKSQMPPSEIYPASHSEYHDQNFNLLKTGSEVRLPEKESVQKLNYLTDVNTDIEDKLKLIINQKNFDKVTGLCKKKKEHLTAKIKYIMGLASPVQKIEIMVLIIIPMIIIISCSMVKKLYSENDDYVQDVPAQQQYSDYEDDALEQSANMGYCFIDTYNRIYYVFDKKGISEDLRVVADTTDTYIELYDVIHDVYRYCTADYSEECRTCVYAGVVIKVPKSLLKTNIQSSEYDNYDCIQFDDGNKYYVEGYFLDEAINSYCLYD